MASRIRLIDVLPLMSRPSGWKTKGAKGSRTHRLRRSGSGESDLAKTGRFELESTGRIRPKRTGRFAPERAGRFQPNFAPGPSPTLGLCFGLAQRG